MLWLRAILLLICLTPLWSGPPEQPRATKHGASCILVIGHTTKGVVIVVEVVTFQTYDAETGLVYLRNRYYDPALGSFTQVDPARDGNNWHGYAGGDPVNRWDPSGLAAYFFDGTCNHPVKKVNPDGLMNYMTNVYLLFTGYSDGDKEAFYMPGIGSGYNKVLKQGEAIQGDGTAGIEWYQSATGTSMNDRADAMIKELEGQLQAGDKTVDVFGFSRGAATAALFLNKIQEKIDSGDQRYQGIDIRFVALFDEVPSDMLMSHQIAGRSLDTAGYGVGLLGAGLARGISIGFWRPPVWTPDVYARNANDPEFRLPEGMTFSFNPYHLVSLDEQRKEFAVTDLVGADQEGFKGVHSNLGGAYGGSLFEMIARNAVMDRAEGFGLNIFRRDAIELFAKGDYGKPGQYDLDKALYDKYMKIYGKNRVSPGNYAAEKMKLSQSSGFPGFIDLVPNDNSNYKFNDSEPRHLPPSMMLHPSALWFKQSPLNAME